MEGVSQPFLFLLLSVSPLYSTIPSLLLVLLHLASSFFSQYVISFSYSFYRLYLLTLHPPSSSLPSLAAIKFQGVSPSTCGNGVSFRLKISFEGAAWRGEVLKRCRDVVCIFVSFTGEIFHQIKEMIHRLQRCVENIPGIEHLQFQRQRAA